MSDIDVRVSDFEQVTKPLKDQTPIPAEIETDDGVYTDDYPGEDDPISVDNPPKILAQRVTQVSDIVLMGSQTLYIPAGSVRSEVALIVPGHRDRLRVRVGTVEDTASILIGHTPNMYSSSDGWTLTNEALIESRDAIYAMAYLATSGESDINVAVQWIIELVTESCGCGK